MKKVVIFFILFMFPLLTSVSFAESKSCVLYSLIAKGCYENRVTVGDVLKLSDVLSNEEIEGYAILCVYSKSLRQAGISLEKILKIIDDICGGTDV